VKSTDGGASWMAIPGSPSLTQVLAFDPRDASTLYSGGPSGLYAITFCGSVLGAKGEPANATRGSSPSGRYGACLSRQRKQ
jgi:hypothetical protein